MRGSRITTAVGSIALGIMLVAGPLMLWTGSSDAGPPRCEAMSAAGHLVGAPRPTLAWRAAPIRTATVYRRIPGAGGGRIESIDATRVGWLLVLAATERHGRCWVKVRLPGRPNDATGWVRAPRLVIRPTPWRLVVSLRARTLTVLRSGRPRLTFSAVVGAPGTPTPRGLFSIVHAWRSDPDAFVGSWVLGLTAHSDVLRHFEGGSGEVGVHGRGGASLFDPLGTAASHGCIRLANRSIDRLVRAVGPGNLPGIPVAVRR